MAGKKMRLRGIKKTPKRLESDIIERSKNLRENPDLIRPKCAGKCFLCPFKGTFNKIYKLGSVKDNADALVKLSSKGSDDIFKAYCGTISLCAAGNIPYLATAKLAGEDVSFAQRGTVGNDKLIGTQYYNDPKIRLLLFNSIAKKKNLHIYSYGDDIICSKKPNMPEDYLYDTFWDTPYEFKDDGLQCGHESDGYLIIEAVSSGQRIEICRDCAKEISTLQFLISRLVAIDPLDDLRVSVSHKYHKEGEDSIVQITDKEIMKKYSLGQMNDVQIINSVLKDKIGGLKSGSVATYIIGTNNYGSNFDDFFANLTGTELEKEALSKYIAKNPRSVIIRTNKASEALSVLWDDYYGILEAFTSAETADEMGDVSKMVPSTVIKDAHVKFISHDVVSKLPVFKRPGPLTVFADRYAKAAMVGGADMLKEEMSNLVPKDNKSRSLAKAFTDIYGLPEVNKCSKEESDFAAYLRPFVQQLLDSSGEDYRYSMNTLLTATGCGEKV